MIDIENIKEKNLYTIRESAKLVDMHYKSFCYKLYKSNIARTLLNNRNYISGLELKRFIEEVLNEDKKE